MSFVLAESYIGSSFWDGFHVTQPSISVSGSWAQYLSASAAEAANLTRIMDSGAVVLQTDYLTGFDVSGVNGTSAQLNGGAYTEKGRAGKRKTVRVESRKGYSAGVVVMDIKHMPGPICGGLSRLFAQGKYADVSLIDTVSVTGISNLHSTTSGSCHLTDNPTLANRTLSDCSTSCGYTTTPSYIGTSWNSANGGVYAMQWARGTDPPSDDVRITDASIDGELKIWAWQREDVPKDVGGGRLEPGEWGKPLAVFGGDGCQGTGYYYDMKLVFDMDICSSAIEKDWKNGCKQATNMDTCAAFASQSPALFYQNYWEINSVNIYVPSQIKPSTTLGGTSVTLSSVSATSLAANSTILKNTETSTFSWTPSSALSFATTRTTTPVKPTGTGTGSRKMKNRRATAGLKSAVPVPTMTPALV